MAHLNLYLPDDVAETLKYDAKEAQIPLSRYVLSRLSANKPGDAWPPGYFDQICGFLTEEIEEPVDAPPEPMDELDLR